MSTWHGIADPLIHIHRSYLYFALSMILWMRLCHDLSGIALINFMSTPPSFRKHYGVLLVRVSG